MYKTKRNNIIEKRVGNNLVSQKPKISVVIPVYNNAEYIGETLRSAIEQKYRDHEIIVVNDGSPDTNKLEVAIQPYREDIIYIKQKNAGAGVARNTGIYEARGEFIAFLDGDDVWMPDFLPSQYIFLQRNGYDMVYCDALLFGMRSVYRQSYMQTAPSVGIANFDTLLDFRCNVITSGTLVRRQAVIDAGLFETARVRAHDYHLWLRIAKNGAKIGYQRKPLLKYRVHLESLSGNAVSRVEREIDVLHRVLDSIELSGRQKKTVANLLARLEADLAVETGKSQLLKGEYREAAASFRSANVHHRSIKLTAVSWLTRIAPEAMVKIYRSKRADEIAFVPTQN